MKSFKFTGFGNYSSHGWDNGLSTNLKEEIDSISEVSGVIETLFNEYGGSRNVEGLVFANSKEEAEQLLREYESTFEVIEYQEMEFIS